MLSQLMIHHQEQARCLYNGSVLDSGSSRHLHPHTHVLDVDNKVSISGFDNSMA